jgi:formylglycine-generating enzyme required for sulfatase activity
MREPLAFPPDWADAWGDDRFGLWAEFEVGGVRQRMRWIEPGEFEMGSHQGEPERVDDEGPQHTVQFSAGFWLADSACTQALWMAVTGADNPSHFKGDDACPVEQVNWDDVQAFMQRLHKELGPSSDPALPTEAQWEYACRAGTITPFNLGANVSPSQINYDGNFPYNGADKGEYRERTVPVTSLPPNRWGLYEMHGNVWEWCADGLRRYDASKVVDPQGPADPGQEDPRALRGGSWLYRAWSARSASRGARRRAGRYHYLGFRLCLRS